MDKRRRRVAPNAGPASGAGSSSSSQNARATISTISSCVSPCHERGFRKRIYGRNIGAMPRGARREHGRFRRLHAGPLLHLYAMPRALGGCKRQLPPTASTGPRPAQTSQVRQTWQTNHHQPYLLARPEPAGGADDLGSRFTDDNQGPSSCGRRLDRAFSAGLLLALNLSANAVETASALCETRPTSTRQSRRARPSFRRTKIATGLRWRISIALVGI